MNENILFVKAPSSQKLQITIVFYNDFFRCKNKIIFWYFSLFLPGFQIFLNPDVRRVFLPPLEARKVQPDYMDPVFGVTKTHHMPFDQILPADRKVRVSQMLQYFLAVLLRVFENRAVILHTHAAHIRALREYGEALRYGALFRVIF